MGQNYSRQTRKTHQALIFPVDCPMMATSKWWRGCHTVHITAPDTTHPRSRPSLHSAPPLDSPRTCPLSIAIQSVFFTWEYVYQIPRDWPTAGYHVVIVSWSLTTNVSRYTLNSNQTNLMPYLIPLANIDTHVCGDFWLLFKIISLDVLIRGSRIQRLGTQLYSPWCCPLLVLAESRVNTLVRYLRYHLKVLLVFIPTSHKQEKSVQ